MGSCRERTEGMKVLDELDLNSSAHPYIIAQWCIPLPRFVMAYDFTASPLIFQHFCHFTQPPLSHPNTSPLNTSSLHLAHSFFSPLFPPIPISLPFVIISRLIFALPRSREQVVLTHRGVGPLTFQRPLQTCNAPFALHRSLFLPTLPFSAVDERHQLEETERNGPNYSIGNWKLAN